MISEPLRNPLSLFDVKGRVAVITGASGTFGRATALALTSLGGKVLLASGSKGELEEVASEVRELGGGQSSVAFDYRIVALRRGSENVRLADMTERSKKANGPLPKAGGGRFTIPVRPTAPKVSGNINLTSAKLSIQQ